MSWQSTLILIVVFFTIMGLLIWMIRKTIPNLDMKQKTGIERIKQIRRSNKIK